MSPRTPGPHALAFILITILVDTIGLGIIIPVVPRVLMGLTGTDESGAALYGGWLLFAYAITQFLFGPVLGNLSDRFGRRPVLLASLIAFGVDYLITAAAPTVGWLFVGRIVAGITGASVSTANAYVADITSPDKRAANYGKVGAAFGLGFVLGPATGGLLAAWHERAPFVAAAVLAFANAIYGYFVLPESLPPESRRHFSMRRANILGTIFQLGRYPGVPLLALGLFLWQLAHQVFPTTWAYYTKLRFGWSEFAIGLSLAYAGILMAAVQGGLAGRLIARMGESRAARVGLFIGAAGMVGYGLSSQGWMIYAVMCVSAFSGLIFPSMNGLLSRRMPPTSQGELQGAVASMMSLTTILSPLIMPRLFARFSSAGAAVYLPGAPYFAGAGLALASFLMVTFADSARSAATAEPTRHPR